MSLGGSDIKDTFSKNRGGRVFVVGGGITARGLIPVLVDAGFKLSIFDQKTIPEQTLELCKAYDIDFVENVDRDFLTDEAEAFCAISSPGVSPDGEFYQEFEKAGLKVYSELDFSLAYLSSPDIAVTGTNGKTTTVQLIDKMFECSKKDARLLGNVGYPFSSYLNADLIRAGISETSEQVSIAELSSYQLQTSELIKPHVAVFMNLTEDHLERHGDLESYLEAKLRIFKNQSSKDWSLVWSRAKEKTKIKSRSKANLAEFGSKGSIDSEFGAWYDIDARSLKVSIPGVSEEYNLELMQLLGEHNFINVSAAALASRLTGATYQGVQQAIDTFPVPEHRLEMFKNSEGLIFVNDSKSTNVASSCAALETVYQMLSPLPVVLMLGGVSKEGSWEPLKELINRSNTKVVTFGTDGPKISNILGAESVFENLRDAVNYSAKINKAKGVVLFSPGCASFDSYQNYMERGQHFKTIAKALEGL